MLTGADGPAVLDVLEDLDGIAPEPRQVSVATDDAADDNCSLGDVDGRSGAWNSPRRRVIAVIDTGITRPARIWWAGRRCRT